MGMKTGLVVGFGVGYVLGARAGRQRYEELKESWDRFVGNPRVQELTEKGKEVVGAATHKGLGAVQGGVEKAASKVREKLGGNEAGAGDETVAG